MRSSASNPMYSRSLIFTRAACSTLVSRFARQALTRSPRMSPMAWMTTPLSACSASNAAPVPRPPQPSSPTLIGGNWGSCGTSAAGCALSCASAWLAASVAVASAPALSRSRRAKLEECSPVMVVPDGRAGRRRRGRVRGGRWRPRLGILAEGLDAGPFRCARSRWTKWPGFTNWRGNRHATAAAAMPRASKSIWASRIVGKPLVRQPTRMPCGLSGARWRRSGRLFDSRAELGLHRYLGGTSTPARSSSRRECGTVVEGAALDFAPICGSLEADPLSRALGAMAPSLGLNEIAGSIWS